MAAIHNVGGQINLQATLSASSAGVSDVNPHHPITCTSQLEIDIEAGEFRCEHVGVPLREERTVYALQHSVAILLIEEAVKRFQAA